MIDSQQIARSELEEALRAEPEERAGWWYWPTFPTGAAVRRSDDGEGFTIALRMSGMPAGCPPVGEKFQRFTDLQGAVDAARAHNRDAIAIGEARRSDAAARRAR